MNTTRWQKIEEVFNAAVDLPADERAAFITSACGEDFALRDEINALLQESDQPNTFLSDSNFALGAQVLSDGAAKSIVGGRLGNYAILRMIGRGGMGEVYTAQDERLGRRVALKLLPQSTLQNQDGVSRFKHEARSASAISHPNVAHIYEIGEAEGRLFIAMEYVDGVTLRERLSRRDLILRESLVIATQVASGIAAAHAEGIIHRDIKPENIMIRRDGLVKVVDFGLAKLTERPPAASSSGEAQFSPQIARGIHTEPGLLLGTATYMSPEQARGQQVDARTDIWSLGVVFYEMLAGKPPFRGATSSDVIAEILKSEPPWLSDSRGGFPSKATHLIRRALLKDQNDRCATTADFLDLLRQLRRELEAEGLLDVHLPLPEDSVAHRRRKQRESTSGDPKSKILATRVSSISPEISGRGGVSTHRPRWLMLAAALLIAMALLTILVLAKSRLLWQMVAHAPKPLELIHLTTDGRVKDAAVSPDGRLLAYVPFVSGKQSLRIKDLSSGEDWQILPPDLVVCWGMRFALNNESLFYVSKQAGGTVNVLYRVPVRGGPSEKLVVNIDSPPGLSPDGMQIAFVRSYPGQHRDALILANVDGSAERELFVRKHPERLVGAGLSWSPDRKMIAVGATRRDDTEAAVLAVRLDDGSSAEVTPWMWAEIAGIVWKNDGRTILFSGQKTGATALQIWKTTYPDGEVTSVTNDNNEYEEATPGPNLLVATERYEIADVWSADQSLGPKRLTNEGHSGTDGLAVTSSGRIIYTQGESFASQLWTMNLDGSNQMLLSKNAGIHPSASNDGKTIAYTAFEGGRHVWLVDADGQNNHQLTFGGGENYGYIAPDAQAVFYVSRDKDRGTLWKIATTGGQPVQLTFAGIILNPLVSPDGKKIACTFRRDEGDKWKLAILPSNGGEPFKTFALPSPFYQVIHWTPDSNAITYLDQVNGVQNIWRQPLDGGAPVKLTNFDEDRIWHYDWAPSGKQFIVSRGGRRRDIVMIKNVD